MPFLGSGELFLVLLVVLVLFGYKRLPAAARSVGRSLRAFKAETRGLAPGDVRGKAEVPTVRGRLGDPAPGAGSDTSTGTGSGSAGDPGSRGPRTTAERGAEPW